MRRKGLFALFPPCDCYPPVQAALSLGDLAVLVDAVLAAATDVVEAVKDEVAVLALANAQEEVNRRRLRKIALATASQAAHTRKSLSSI